MSSVSRKGLDVHGFKTVKKAEAEALDLMKYAMTQAVYHRKMTETGTEYDYDSAEEQEEADFITDSGPIVDEEEVVTPSKLIWKEAQEAVEAGLVDTDIESHYQYNYFIVVNAAGQYFPMMGPIFAGKPIKTSEDGMMFEGNAMSKEQQEELSFQFEDDADALLEVQ
jgi:hypothetical protein